MSFLEGACFRWLEGTPKGKKKKKKTSSSGAKELCARLKDPRDEVGGDQNLSSSQAFRLRTDKSLHDKIPSRP